MLKRTTALVLCAMLLFSLFGCTTAPETTVTTTSPAPGALADYNAAADAVNAADTMTLTITMNETMTVGESVFQEQLSQTLILQGVGTEAFAASSTGLYRWLDGYYIAVDEQFTAGTYYQTVDARPYTMEMTAEEFLQRQVPGVILTGELYESVVFTDDGTIEFSGATTLEGWLATETAVLTEASGTATLDENGALTGSTYHAAYTDGPADFVLDITVAVDLAEASAKEPLTIAYDPIDHPDAVIAQERAYGYLLQASSTTSTMSETTISYAAAYLRTETTVVDTWGVGGEQMIQLDYKINDLDYSTMETAAYSTTETYANGAYSYTEDGGEAQTDSTVTGEDMAEYAMNLLTYNFTDLSYAESFETSDLGEYLLIECENSVEFGRIMNEFINYNLFSDESFLDGYASAYRTETADTFMGIDVLTGLPTSIGITYEGIHTIEGVEYSLMYQASQNFDLGSLSSYQTITDEPLPTDEPPAAITPLFYHVTGPDGQEMWMLGTIHVGDARTSNLPQQILDAFAASDALAVEFDSNAFEEAMATDAELQSSIAEAYYYTDGTSAEDHIEDEELYEYTVDMLKVTGDYSDTVLMMKPYILANTVENWFLRQGYDLTSEYGVDNQLLAMAEEQGKEIRDVESGLFQVQMLTGFSDELQEMLLLETMSTTAIEYNAECKELFEMWCAGDEAGLIEYINAEPEEELTEEEQKLLDEYNNAMGPDRNDDMLDVAVGYLESGDTVFFAVGLAHLLDETGLVNTLRDAGYTVELVSYTE